MDDAAWVFRGLNPKNRVQSNVCSKTSLRHKTNLRQTRRKRPSLWSVLHVNTASSIIALQSLYPRNSRRTEAPSRSHPPFIGQLARKDMTSRCASLATRPELPVARAIGTRSPTQLTLGPPLCSSIHSTLNHAYLPTTGMQESKSTSAFARLTGSEKYRG